VGITRRLYCQHFYCKSGGIWEKNLAAETFAKRIVSEAYQICVKIMQHTAVLKMDQGHSTGQSLFR
jgi:hypothetical protein